MGSNTKKRLFIIGASILQLPAIQKAKEMGLHVGVADYNPKAIGIAFADEYYNVSTIDEKGVYEAAKAFRADGIMTIATDMPMRSVAYACSRLGLVGISYDTAIKCTDKGEMIKAFEDNGVEHPWYYILDTLDDLDHIKEKIIYPCISKPTDNAGSRGVMLINNKIELLDAVKFSSKHGRKGSVIIEEYMRGNEVSVEVIVNNGIPHILAVTDKITTGAPHFVEMGHSQPSCLDEEKVQKIKDLACRAIKAVGIENGPAHVEIMLTKNGPKMIELGARMGGDCICTHLVPLSTGIDMVKAAIQIVLSETPDIDYKYQKGSAIRYFRVEDGVIEKIYGLDKAQRVNGIKEIVITRNIGELICGIECSTDRVGFVIAQGENANEAISICNKATDLITFKIKKQDN